MLWSCLFHSRSFSLLCAWLVFVGEEANRKGRKQANQIRKQTRSNNGAKRRENFRTAFFDGARDSEQSTPRRAKQIAQSTWSKWMSAVEQAISAPCMALRCSTRSEGSLCRPCRLRSSFLQSCRFSFFSPFPGASPAPGGFAARSRLPPRLPGFPRFPGQMALFPRP